MYFTVYKPGIPGSRFILVQMQVINPKKSQTILSNYF